MSADPKIVAVEAIPVAVAGARPFRISEGETKRHVSVLLRLKTDRDGLEGNAEIVSAPPGKPEEIVEEILGAVAGYVAPALVGLSVHDRRLAMARVNQALKGRIWTKAGVNNALYDLGAKALGRPVAALLGGRVTDRIPVIGPVIGVMSPEAMAREAAEQARAGVNAVKIKIGETPEADIARVKEVRGAIPVAMRLRVDANDHYRPADAIRLIRAIERYDIEHVEQPLPRGDLLGMAEVRRAVGVALMTDDAVASPEDAIAVIRLGAADRVKVKVSKHGLDGAQTIISMLEAAGIACVLGHVFQMGLARLAEAQLAACVRNVVLPHEMGSMRPMGVTQDIIADELEPTPGMLRLPEGPGLGAKIDWATVEKLRVDRGGGTRLHAVG
ncbi:MAG: mandelate racemase/muconate lactonizing enzyme family protein [Rhodospirillales bacterium]